jgi:hypothetical protein
MKAIALAAILLSGCAANSAVAPAGRSLDEPALGIITNYRHTATPPIVVSFQAVTEGLAGPLKYHWNLGNGTHWSGPQPLPQSYGVGRYDVILTVTDGAGRIKRASVAIDSQSHGCGF